MAIMWPVINKGSIVCPVVLMPQMDTKCGGNSAGQIASLQKMDW